jgi:hypothetical protein
MPEIELIEKSFNPGISKEYDLSIQTDLNGFSFLIYHPDEKNYYCFKKYSFKPTCLTEQIIDNFSQVISSDRHLRLAFNRCLCSFLTPRFTLVPFELFENDKIKELFEFNNKLEELDELHLNYIEEIKAYIIFSAPNYLTNVFTQYFQNIQFSHHTLPLFNLLFSGTTYDNEQILLNINSSFFDIIIKNKLNKLVSYNTFPFENENDIAYYLLHTCKQLNMEPDDVFIWISGEESRKLRNTAILKQYFKHIEDIPSANFELHGNLQRLSIPAYYNLLNIHHCVL